MGIIQERIMKEIEQIPEAKLPEVYALIHDFRLKLQGQPDANPTLQLAGAWADMPEATFQALMNEIGVRRQAAFSKRRSRAARVG